MPIESVPVSMAGPFVGVSCLRWRWQSEQGVRSPLAINVDPSRGTIKPRDGFLTMRRPSDEYRVLGVRGFSTVKGDRLIAVMYWKEQTFETLFEVLSTNGDPIDASFPISLNTHPTGLPPDPFGYPVWMELHGKLMFTTPIGRAYVYDYMRDKVNPRVLQADSDWESSEDKASFPYLANLPMCSIFHNFNGQMVYAGLNFDHFNSTTTPIPFNQTKIPAQNLDLQRGHVRYPASTFLMSDPAMPTAVMASNYFDVGVGNNITGISSINNQLLILTETSIHVGTGAPSGLQSIGILTEGVGCVGHRTVCSGRGIVAWMAQDGFYTYNGSEIRKISDDIEDLFTPTGWRVGPMRGVSQDLLKWFPFPFRIALAQVKRASGTFDVERNCFWWSVPVGGTADVVNDRLVLGESQATICLVYYPALDAWAIYAPADDSVFIPTCFHSWFDGSRMKLLFGDELGGVNVYGYESADKTKAATTVRSDTNESIVWLWQSPGMEAHPNVTGSARSLRVRQKATGGSYEDGSGNVLRTSGLRKWYVEADKTFDESAYTAVGISGADTVTVGKAIVQTSETSGVPSARRLTRLTPRKMAWSTAKPTTGAARAPSGQMVAPCWRRLSGGCPRIGALDTPLSHTSPGSRSTWGLAIGHGASVVR